MRAEKSSCWKPWNTPWNNVVLICTFASRVVIECPAQEPNNASAGVQIGWDK